jgi:hypothetical protein
MIIIKTILVNQNLDFNSGILLCWFRDEKIKSTGIHSFDNSVQNFIEKISNSRILKCRKFLKNADWLYCQLRYYHRSSPLIISDEIYQKISSLMYNVNFTWITN